MHGSMSYEIEVYVGENVLCVPHLSIDVLTSVTTVSLAPSEFKLVVESAIQFSSCLQWR